MRYKLLFCAYAALIFLAYMQPLNQQVFALNRFGTTSSVPIQIMYLCTWVAPIVPLIVACFVMMGKRHVLARSGTVLAVVSLLIGFVLTLASGVLSLFSTTQQVHGATLTIAVASSFAVWSGRDHEPVLSRIAKLGITVATIAALWSLLTVPVVMSQSHAIAGGSPNCIAMHSPGSPVPALHQLR